LTENESDPETLANSDDGMSGQGGSDDPEATTAQAPEQKIVTLRLVARNNGAFAGDELVLSLRGIGMRHGKFGIFHQHDGDEESQVVFSAASLVEPGSFDIQNIRDQEIPGISLFMVVPGPVDGAKAFDSMMTAARALAQTLDAELLDESGSTLSIQRERYLREEIIQHEHSPVVV
jgi:cell division protein ZipA